MSTRSTSFQSGPITGTLARKTSLQFGGTTQQFRTTKSIAGTNIKFGGTIPSKFSFVITNTSGVPVFSGYFIVDRSQFVSVAPDPGYYNLITAFYDYSQPGIDILRAPDPVVSGSDNGFDIISGHFSFGGTDINIAGTYFQLSSPPGDTAVNLWWNYTNPVLDGITTYSSGTDFSNYIFSY